MNTKPIIFQDAMVRALLKGQKTQTRRVVKGPIQWDGNSAYPHWQVWMRCEAHGGEYAWVGANEAGLPGLLLHEYGCPYGQPGDLLWVRETHHVPGGYLSADLVDEIRKGISTPESLGVIYRSDAPGLVPHDGGWAPSIHMPRWASRLTLRLTDVRVERVQEISEADARAEGAQYFGQLPGKHPTGQDHRWSMESPTTVDQCLLTAKSAFANYYCKVHSKSKSGLHDPRPWDANPWVWVLEFKVIHANVHQVPGREVATA